DIPRIPDALPRALTPDVDRALTTAIANLDDALVRTGLLLLRATGMRIGELLDLELDCLLDFAGHGTWLRVPVGKLNSERMVPLDPDTVQVIDAWIAQRVRQRHSGCARACSTRPPSPGCAAATGSCYTSRHTSCGTPSAPA